MASWKDHLKADSTEWLLQPDNPGVRYYALRDLCDLPVQHPDAIQARSDIMQTGLVPLILARQQPGGYWGQAPDFYVRSKYRGTVWTLILLAELGAHGLDPRLRLAVEFTLMASLDRESSGFAFKSNLVAGGDHNAVIPCLTGNMLYCLVRFGYFSDPRAQAVVQWILRYQRLDDRVKQAPRGWPYDAHERCWGKHSCHLGVVKTLKALAEIPPDQRSEEVCEFIDMSAAYLLRHGVYRSSHYPDRIAMPRWLNFGFPLMVNTDALEVLDILTRLGYRDPRMQEAVDLVESKQDADGRWILETSWNTRMQVAVERVGLPSKWLTLRAMGVLKRYYGF